MKPSTSSLTRSRVLELELDHAGESLPVEVEMRRQPKARHFRLRVKTRWRALLTLPWNASYDEAEAFLEKNQDWLAEHLWKSPKAESLSQYMKEQPFLTIRGRAFQVNVLEEAGRTRVDSKLDRESLEVNAFIPPQENGVRSAMWTTILKHIAKVQLDLRVCDLAERVSLQIPDVSVRDQESRWGSCSTSGRLSLNWRLILLPPVLQDYVIYHELAHMTEHNHSPHFWDLLHTYDPRAGRHDKALGRDYGFLMHFGRA